MCCTLYLELDLEEGRRAPGSAGLDGELRRAVAHDGGQAAGSFLLLTLRDLFSNYSQGFVPFLELVSSQRKKALPRTTSRRSGAGRAADPAHARDAFDRIWKNDISSNRITGPLKY